MIQFLPMLMQMLGSMGGGAAASGAAGSAAGGAAGGSGGGGMLGSLGGMLGGGGGGYGGGGGGQGGGMGMAANPAMKSLMGGLGAGLSTGAPVMPTDGGGSGQSGYAPPPQQQPLPNYPQQGSPFGGDQQQLGYQGSVPAGNGSPSGSGPLEGLGGAGAMPTEASNFGRIFGGGGMPGTGSLGMASSPTGSSGGGLQALMQMLQGGFGGGLR